MFLDFTFPTKLLIGAGSLSKLKKISLPGRKALVVASAGGSLRRSGAMDKILSLLGEREVETVLFEKVLPNPIQAHVTEGCALAKETGCDFIIGIGGGSVIDTAKAIALTAANGGDFYDYVAGGSGKAQRPKNAPLPTVAIPTTAGTGTESDPWAVITDEKTQEKIGFGFKGSKHTFPTISIVDSDLMLSVPPRLTAFQGFDALFHATEGYISSTSSPISDMFALKAISLIGENLAEAVNNGSNSYARENMALASTLAGIVEWTSACIGPHALEHGISAVKSEVAHGEGLIILAKAYYSKMAANCDKMTEMARALGKKDASCPQDFVTRLAELMEQCGVADLTLSAHGITEADLPLFNEKAWDMAGYMFKCDPIRMSKDETLELLKEAYC